MGHKWLLGHAVETHATGAVVEDLLSYPHSGETFIGNHRKAMERLLESTALLAENAIDDYTIRGEVKLVGEDHTETLRMRGQQSAGNCEEIFVPRRRGDVWSHGVPFRWQTETLSGPAVVKAKHVDGNGTVAYSFVVRDPSSYDPSDFRMDSDGNLFWKGEKQL